MPDFLDISNIHLNSFQKEEFNINAEENAHLKESLLISVDGSIVAVAKDKVLKHLKDKDVNLIRMGMRPFPKYIEIKNEDDFWKCLSYFVDIEEDY